MKRLAVLCIVLLALASLAFGEIKIEPKVTLAAYGQLTWGIDLSEFDTGFKNESDADLTLTFIAADTAETKKGEGAAYGEIKISDIEVWLGGDDAATITGTVGWLTDADVSAKIVVTPIEIGIFGAPTMYVDMLTEIEVDANDDNIVDKTEGLNANGIYYAGGGGVAQQPFDQTTYGTWVKATLGPLAATVKIASTDWTQLAGDDDVNSYAVGLDGVLTVTPLTVSFGGYADFVDNDVQANDPTYGFYGKVAGTFGPIALWAGIEANIADNAVPLDGFAFVTGGNVTFTITTGTTVAVTALYGEPINGLDLKFAFVEPEAGLIPALDLGVTFYLLDVGEDSVALDGMEYEAIVTGGYKVAMNDTQYIRPYFTFKYGAGNEVPANSFEAYMYAEAGVQLQLIPLTLFTVKYVSGDLATDTVQTEADTGSIQFVAKVSY